MSLNRRSNSMLAVDDLKLLLFTSSILDNNIEVICSEFLLLISKKIRIDIVKIDIKSATDNLLVKLIGSNEVILADNFNALYNFIRGKCMTQWYDDKTNEPQSNSSSSGFKEADCLLQLFIPFNSIKEISRIINRVQKWKSHWISPTNSDMNDDSSLESQKLNAESKIENNIAPQLLLERQLRHHDAKHIINCFSGKNNAVKMKSIGICIADVYLYVLLNQWFRNHINVHTECISIKQNYPAILTFMYSIHTELSSTCVNFSCLQTSLLQVEINKLSSIFQQNENELLLALNTLLYDNFIKNDKIKLDLDKSIKLKLNPNKIAINSNNHLIYDDEYINLLLEPVNWIGSTDCSDSTHHAIVAVTNFDANNSSGSSDNNFTRYNKCKSLFDSNIISSDSETNTNTNTNTYNGNGSINNANINPNIGLSEEFWDKLSLPKNRFVRKRQQIESMLAIVNNLLPQNGSVVEFCAGGGYVGLAIAYIRPDVQVILTDMNNISLSFADKRKSNLNLTNVHIVRCELSQIQNDISILFSTTVQTFDLGISLHACGTAADVVQDICTQNKSSFIISPCCYGFLQHWINIAVDSNNNANGIDANDTISNITDLNEMMSNCKFCNTNVGNNMYNVTDQSIKIVQSSNNYNIDINGNCSINNCKCLITDNYTKMKTAPKAKIYIDKDYVTENRMIYPRSTHFRNHHIELLFFQQLCQRADRTFFNHDDRSITNNPIGKLAMKAIDTDRILAARESGVYGSVLPYFMTPLDASPKNHILVGKRQ